MKFTIRDIMIADHLVRGGVEQVIALKAGPIKRIRAVFDDSRACELVGRKLEAVGTFFTGVLGCAENFAVENWVDLTALASILTQVKRKVERTHLAFVVYLNFAKQDLIKAGRFVL